MRAWQRYEPTRVWPSPWGRPMHNLSTFERHMTQAEMSQKPPLDLWVAQATESQAMANALLRQLQPLHAQNNHPPHHQKHRNNDQTMSASSHPYDSMSFSDKEIVRALIYECRTRVVHMRNVCARLSVAQNVPADALEHCLIVNDLLQQAVMCHDYDLPTAFYQASQPAPRPLREVGRGEEAREMGLVSVEGHHDHQLLPPTTTTTPASAPGIVVNSSSGFSALDSSASTPISPPSPNAASASPLYSSGVQLLRTGQIKQGAVLLTSQAATMEEQGDVHGCLKTHATIVSAAVVALNSTNSFNHLDASEAFDSSAWRLLATAAKHGMHNQGIGYISHACGTRSDLCQRALGMAQQIGGFSGEDLERLRRVWV